MTQIYKKILCCGKVGKRPAVISGGYVTDTQLLTDYFPITDNGKIVYNWLVIKELRTTLRGKPKRGRAVTRQFLGTKKGNRLKNQSIAFLFWYWVGESNSYCEIENLEY